MNDSLAQDAVFVVIGFLVVIGPIILVIPIVLKRHAILGKAFNGVKNAAAGVAKATGKAGKKAALNTKQGQAAQQFMANRKAVAGLKGKEFLRQKAEKNPMIASLMGGIGGGDISNRLFDQQNRAKRAEDIKNINGSLTGSVASAMGNRHENLGIMLQEIEDPRNAGRKFNWRNADGSISKREVADEDIAAMRKLRQQGFIGVDGNVKNDSLVATAAMQKIFETELAGEENIAGVSRMLAGASAEENRDYSEELRKAAAAHKYKNFAGATVNNGQVSQYYAKMGQNEINPDGSVNNVRLEGAKKVLDSGLRGINKDALDQAHDSSLLEAIKDKYESYVDQNGKVDTASAQLRREMVVKIADETSHIDKRAVLDQIASQMGVSGDEFVSIQRSLKSGGAVAMPPGYNLATPAVVTQFTPQAHAQPAPQAFPQMTGTLNVPHGGGQASPPPAPVQTMPPPLPRPQPGPGNGPRSNRPPSGPGGPSGPSGPGRP